MTNRLHLRQIEHGLAQVGRKTDGKQTDVINSFEQCRKVLRKQMKSNLIFYLSYRNVHIVVETNKTFTLKISLTSKIFSKAIVMTYSRNINNKIFL